MSRRCRGDSHAIARLAPEDLRQIKPGLDGFFARWWDDQRRLWGRGRRFASPRCERCSTCWRAHSGLFDRTTCCSSIHPDSGLSTWTLGRSRWCRSAGSSSAMAVRAGLCVQPSAARELFLRAAPAGAGEARRHEARFIEWGTTTLDALRAGTARSGCRPALLDPVLMTHFERARSEVGTLSRSGQRRVARCLVGPRPRAASRAFLATSAVCGERPSRRTRRSSQAAPRRAVSRRGDPVRAVRRRARAASPRRSRRRCCVALVKQQVWTPAQGLAYASNIAEDAIRVDTLLDLLGCRPAGEPRTAAWRGDRRRRARAADPEELGYAPGARGATPDRPLARVAPHC